MRLTNYKKACMLLVWALAILGNTYAQNAAAPQPIKKTSNTQSTTPSANKPAPWEKQPIEHKSSSTHTTSKTPAKNLPAAAQPVQRQ